jgi:hypothetical protein
MRSPTKVRSGHCRTHNTYRRFHETERNLEAEQMRVPALKPDVHSVSLVGTEVWAIDQAATGSMMTYEVYHKCGAYPVDS